MKHELDNQKVAAGCSQLLKVQHLLQLISNCFINEKHVSCSRLQQKAGFSNFSDLIQIARATHTFWCNLLQLYNKYNNINKIDSCSSSCSKLQQGAVVQLTQSCTILGERGHPRKRNPWEVANP
jgi:hypothetical protein